MRDLTWSRHQLEELAERRFLAAQMEAQVRPMGMAAGLWTRPALLFAVPHSLLGGGIPPHTPRMAECCCCASRLGLPSTLCHQGRGCATCALFSSPAGSQCAATGPGAPAGLRLLLLLATNPTSPHPCPQRNALPAHPLLPGADGQAKAGKGAKAAAANGAPSGASQLTFADLFKAVNMEDFSSYISKVGVDAMGRGPLLLLRQLGCCQHAVLVWSARPVAATRSLLLPDE